MITIYYNFELSKNLFDRDALIFDYSVPPQFSTGVNKSYFKTREDAIASFVAGMLLINPVLHGTGIFNIHEIFSGYPNQPGFAFQDIIKQNPTGFYNALFGSSSNPFSFTDITYMVMVSNSAYKTGLDSIAIPELTVIDIVFFYIPT